MTQKIKQCRLINKSKQMLFTCFLLEQSHICVNLIIIFFSCAVVVSWVHSLKCYLPQTRKKKITLQTLFQFMAKYFQNSDFVKICSNGKLIHCDGISYSKDFLSLFHAYAYLLAIIQQNQILATGKKYSKKESMWKELMTMMIQCFTTMLSKTEECKRIFKVNFLSEALQKMRKLEKQKQQDILQLILDVAMFYRKKILLPFKESQKITGNPSSGMFANLIELLCNYVYIASHKVDDFLKICALFV